MCARLSPRRAPSAVVLALVAVAACSSPERTGTAFCRQLADELPAIAAPATTGDEVAALVSRWERLLERSPLAIERDVETVTDLLRAASRVDPTDPVAVQELADQSYASNSAAVSVRDWVMSTCAVDVATGLQIAPPRTVPPTTTPAAETDSDAPADSVVTGDTTPATGAP
ncbi:MAG: hypothetical protein RLY50_966 [Actinomycetota bacterium]